MNARLHKVILFGLLLGSSAARAQVPHDLNWQLVKEGRGIQVYTAPGPASGLKYIKVSAALWGTLQAVDTLFKEIGRQPEWVFSTRRAHLVQRTDARHLVYYNETALPWPVSNREVFIRMSLAEDPQRHTLVIDQEAVSSAVPVAKGLVRVKQLSGQWLFRDEGRGQLHVDYYLYVDPGGSLPAWVVNMFVAKGPYETLVKLGEQLPSAR